MTQMYANASERSIPAEQVDPTLTNLSSLATRLVLMEAAGEDPYTLRQEHTRGVLAIVAATHDREVIQTRDALWDGIATSLEAGEPYGVAYNRRYASNGIAATWRFRCFQPPSFEEPVANDETGETPLAMNIKATIPSFKLDEAFLQDLDQALGYAQDRPVFSARRRHQTALGLGLEKIGRNKFHFNQAALGVRIGEALLARTQSLDVTIYNTPEAELNTSKIGQDTVQRYEAFGIDDTTRQLQLRPLDIAYTSESMLDGICHYLREVPATMPQESYRRLYDKYVKPDLSTLDFPRLVYNWLRQPEVMPVTAQSFASATDRSADHQGRMIRN